MSVFVKDIAMYERYVVIFLDGNGLNCEISNLACALFNYLGYLSGNFNRSDNAVVTKVQVEWVKLRDELRRINGELEKVD